MHFVKEERERTYSDMLILHIPNALKHPSPDRITQILRRRLGMNIPEVNRPIKSLHARRLRTRARRRVRREWGERAREGVRRRGRKRACGLGDERLRSGNLGGLGGGLLRLGNVGAPVLAVIDPLACPRGFGGERVDDLGDCCHQNLF